MTAKEIYEKLHSIDVIAEMETKKGVWYIQNTIDEYRSIPSSYYPTLMACVEGLQESSDWFCPKGTGTICFVEYGIRGKVFRIYSGDFNGKWGRLWI